MPRVTHFELHALDPDRAADFYRAVFGWKIEKWPGPVEYWLITTGDEGEPGIDGGIDRREGALASNVFVDVASVDDVTEAVVAAGGRVVSPRVAVPGVGYAAYYEDTEGIGFGVMQSDPGAA
jgi:predicted enzyme related to lactoylglutathione lyase